MIKKLIAVVLVLLAVGAGYAIYELQRYHDSNENESSEMRGDIGAAPDFYVSDTALLKPGQRRIRETRDPALGNPKEVPYFIQFEDGRYVWSIGTDIDSGLTRDIFSDVPYRVYWGDDAMTRWLELHPMGHL
jgi:hypothetical protein